VYAAQRQQVIDQVEAGKLAQLKVATRDGAGLIQEAMATLARQAAAQMIAEAAHQGVLINPDQVKINPVKLGKIAGARAAQIGAYLAQQATRKVLQVAAAAPAGTPADQVGVFLDGLSQRPLADQLHGALMAAQNSGRFAAAQAAPAAAKETAVWQAVEVLDQNTCEACAAIDGSQFDTAAEAEAEYPGGGYFDCAGFDRCRGTCMVLWSG
jgi:hypothetical protein